MDEAWAIAQDIGLPVVVKPQDGNQGKGVTVNITTREQLDMAYRVAAEIGEVMVERFLPGSDYRLLVVGENCVALCVLVLAASRMDVWSVVANARLSDREIDLFIDHAQPRRVVYTPHVSPEAGSIARPRIA